MKKVLVIAPYAYLPWYSGGQKFIGQFLQHLADKTDLTVISVAANDGTLAVNYKMIPLLKKSFSRYYDFSLIKKITTIVKENGFDTVIWEHPYYAWLAFRVRRRTGVRTIIHTHNIEHLRFKSTGRWWWPILKWYEKRCFRKADGIFFITPEDREFAIRKWNISPSKCYDLPFGTEIRSYPADREQCSREIRKRHHIAGDQKIFLFTGALEYKPNMDALTVILEKISPLLMSEPGLKYKIVVCGKGLPASMNELKDYMHEHIIYAGFAADIEVYYKGADVFLNPVQSGGGIKTKMVEAIACGTSVVSSATGAVGIDKAVCGNKLFVVNDNDWRSFGAEVIRNAEQAGIPTPGIFYEKYSWDNIILNLMRQVK